MDFKNMTREQLIAARKALREASQGKDLIEIKGTQVGPKFAYHKTDKDGNTTTSQRHLGAAVGELGTVNIYGLNRSPVCLYPDQIVKLRNALNDIESFVDANKAELERKGSKANQDKVRAKRRREAAAKELAKRQEAIATA